MSTPLADRAARDTVRTALDRTLFVEAGAGTGKTTELVARVVEAVATARLPAMQALAAITFTENAAAELRIRIREALESGAAGRHRDRCFDSTERSRLATALVEIDDAAITTLHGFAARVLQDVPLEAGLPPGFVVHDAIRARLDATARWRAFLDDLLDDATVAQHLLVALTLDGRTEKLREVADAFGGSWDALQDRPFRDVPLPTIDAHEVLAGLRRAVSWADAGPDGDKLMKHLRDVVLPAVDELSSLDDPMDVLDALNRLSFRSRLGDKSALSRAGVDKAAVVAALDEADDARKAILASAGAAATETLCARLQDFVLAEAERRRREGSLTFHDLLVLTRDVLRSDASVRKRLHDRYPVLLIDEFQDTDPLQVEIVCLIAGEGAPAPWPDIPVPEGGLFFVGDAKQSIYRFRRADVQLYSAVGDRFEDGRTRLDVNFRSVPAVVQAVNHVFDDLIGQTSTGQVPYQELRTHRRDHAPGAAVRLLGGPTDGGADALREAESAHLADIAVRAKAERWQVSGRNGLQDASYCDVAVLLPTRTSLPAIEAALQARDVPYRIESRSLVWATDAVRDVITLLQALAAPADEVALMATLRSPGLACSDRDLVEWAAAGGRWSYLAPKPEGVAGDHPVTKAMATLRGYHDLRWWLPVNELLERIVRELRLVELTAELRRPRDHWRRLRFVVDQARAFCDAGGHGLGEFVQWATDQIETEADVLETVVPEADDDAVRILTVHGSKGLEFPITVVAGLGTGPRTETTVLWGPARPEVRLKADWLCTTGFDARKGQEKELAQAEAVRLLYVAMTRAQDFLVLGCHHKTTGASYGSHAQQLWRLLGDGARAVLEPEPTGGDLASPPVQDTEWLLDHRSRDEVAAAHQALLAAVRARVATTPTALVAAAAEAGESDPDFDGKFEKADAEPLVVARRGLPSRTGPAIGTAVHGVLELADLTVMDANEFWRLADMLAARADIPTLAGDVARRALAAANVPLVREAAASGRFWREVYLVVQDGERVVEGYVDLLLQDAEGEFVVVDYKTDRATGTAEVAAKVKHYRPQLAAYGWALSRVLQQVISRGALVLAGTDAAEVAVVDAGSD